MNGEITQRMETVRSLRLQPCHRHRHSQQRACFYIIFEFTEEVEMMLMMMLLNDRKVVSVVLFCGCETLCDVVVPTTS